jgi:hypothetical protein
MSSFQLRRSHNPNTSELQTGSDVCCRTVLNTKTGGAEQLRPTRLLRSCHNEVRVNGGRKRSYRLRRFGEGVVGAARMTRHLDPKRLPFRAKQT